MDRYAGSRSPAGVFDVRGSRGTFGCQGPMDDVGAMTALIKKGNLAEFISRLDSKDAKKVPLDSITQPHIADTEKSWLAVAVDHSEIAFLEVLVKRGAHLHQTVGPDKQSLLHLVHTVGVAKFLISHGLTNLELKNACGNTPFMVTIASNHVDLARFLMEQGCNAYAKDNGDRNALDIALRQGQNCHQLGYLGIEPIGLDQAALEADLRAVIPSGMTGGLSNQLSELSGRL